MKHIDKLIAASMLIVTATFLPGCSDKGNLGDAAQSKKNYVKIISMKPSLSEILVAGSNVEFEIGVKYSMREESGVITLVIQRAESSFMPLASEIEVIQSGEGRLILRASVDIPDTKAIQIFTPLYPQGVNQTSVVDSRIYKVVHGHRLEA